MAWRKWQFRGKVSVWRMDEVRLNMFFFGERGGNEGGGRMIEVEEC